MQKMEFSFDNLISFFRSKLVFRFLLSFLILIVIGKLVSAFVYIWKLQFIELARPLFHKADDTLPTFGNVLKYLVSPFITPKDSQGWYVAHESLLNDLQAFKLGFLLLVTVLLIKKLQTKFRAYKRYKKLNKQLPSTNMFHHLETNKIKKIAP